MDFVEQGEVIAFIADEAVNRAAVAGTNSYSRSARTGAAHSRRKSNDLGAMRRAMARNNPVEPEMTFSKHSPRA